MRAPHVEVAPEVERLLDSAGLAEVVSIPARESVVCTICAERIPAGAGEPLSAIARRGPPTGPALVFQYAHRRCGASGLYLEQPTVAPAEFTLHYAGLLVPGAAVPALLLLDVISLRATGEEADVGTLLHEQDGFRRVTDAVEDLEAPAARGWTLRRVDRDTLVLMNRREAVHRLEDVRPTMPAGWFDAAAAARQCMVVVGTRLALEQPDIAHINLRLQLGTCAAASVRYRSDRRR